jgi:hypothetical protein
MKYILVSYSFTIVYMLLVTVPILLMLNKKEPTKASKHIMTVKLAFEPHDFIIYPVNTKILLIASTQNFFLTFKTGKVWIHNKLLLPQQYS